MLFLACYKVKITWTLSDWSQLAEIKRAKHYFGFYMVMKTLYSRKLFKLSLQCMTFFYLKIVVDFVKHVPVVKLRLQNSPCFCASPQ